MRAIRAAEIGAYLYCRRAWWYQQQGIAPPDETGLDAGSLYHRQHGQRILQARLMRLGGWLVLLGALVTGAVTLVGLILP